MTWQSKLARWKGLSKAKPSNCDLGVGNIMLLSHRKALTKMGEVSRNFGKMNLSWFYKRVHVQTGCPLQKISGYQDMRIKQLSEMICEAYMFWSPFVQCSSAGLRPLGTSFQQCTAICNQFCWLGWQRCKTTGSKDLSFTIGQDESVFRFPQYRWCIHVWCYIIYIILNLFIKIYSNRN